MPHCFPRFVVTCLVTVVTASGQNLLFNGSFEETEDPCGGVSGWVNSGPEGTCSGSSIILAPSSQSAFHGNNYASTVKYGTAAGDASNITQTVEVYGGETLLAGFISGSQICGSVRHFARLHDGADISAPVIAEYVVHSAPDWMDGAVDIVATPTGSQVTVSWGWEVATNTCWNTVATHADAFMFAQTMQPSITGTISMQSLSTDAYSFDRDVVFAATDNAGTPLGTWTETVTFINDPGTRTASGTYRLESLSAETAHLSAKAELMLRKKKPVTFDAENRGVVDFVVVSGDLDASNSVNLLDYSILKTNWLTTNVAGDINGDGQVQILDYALLKTNWFTAGDDP